MKLTYITLLLLFISCQNFNQNYEDTHASPSLTKVILYTELENCNKMVSFYHELIGLDICFATDNFSWVEFETGASHLCIHHNNKREEPYATGAVHVVLQVGDDEAVHALHNKVLASGYQQVQISGKGISKHLEPGQVSNMFRLNAHKGGQHPSFWISDPAGNFVQIEPKILPAIN